MSKSTLSNTFFMYFICKEQIENILYFKLICIIGVSWFKEHYLAFNFYTILCRCIHANCLSWLIIENDFRCSYAFIILYMKRAVVINLPVRIRLLLAFLFSYFVYQYELYSMSSPLNFLQYMWYLCYSTFSKVNVWS